MREYTGFNPTQKARFLKTIDKEQYPEFYWERLFEKSKSREEKHNKDLCNFTTPEIIEFFKYVDTASIDTLNVMRINLIKYGDWCLENTLIDDNQNHFREITNEMIGNCVSNIRLQNSIITKKQFDQFLFKIDNYRDRFVFMSLFEGISGKAMIEITNMKIGDINEEDNTVRLCTGRIIGVSKQFIDIAKEADKQLFYYDTSGRKYNLIPTSEVYKQIMKSKKGSTLMSSKETLVQQLFRVIKSSRNYGYYLSVKSLCDSGAIDMINTICRENNMSAENVLYNSNYFGDIHNKYNINPNIRRKFLLKYNDFLE